MKRPVLHDKRFAMSSDWEQHAEALEEYATYLEGGLAVLKVLVAEHDRTNAQPKPGAFQDLMDSFFGPNFKPTDFGK